MSKKRKATGIPCTDTGNAEQIAVLFGDVLRYDHKQGRWLIWDRRRYRWNEDGANEVRNVAIAAARQRRMRAASLADTEKSKYEIQWTFESENRHKLDAALEIAKSLPPISDPGDGWDADHWLLGVANGVVDLRRGKLREERPDDRITMHSGVRFDPAAKCPRFEKFLNQIFNGDMALVDYMHRSIGYLLTGSIREQCVFCWHGSGANGKTTLHTMLRHILGEYAVNLPFSALEMKNRNSNDLVALAGSRLATAAETNEGVQLNEARLKVLTGGDPITARRLYHESFTFEPTHKLVLAFNHKPVIADDSEGMWRRVRLIPFARQFKQEEQDKDLPDALRAEAAGILAWSVRGCLLWQKEGLGMPPSVQQATAAYREESDHVGQFIQDCCIVQPDARVTSATLWQRYQAWTTESEEVPLSRQTFAARLERHGYRCDRKGHNGTRMWVGLRLVVSEMVSVMQTLFGSTSDAGTLTRADTVSTNLPKCGDKETLQNPCQSASGVTQ